MRTLTDQEIEEVSGGFLPVIAFAASLAGHMTGFGGVAGWAASSIGLIASSAGLAAYMHEDS